MNENVKKVFAYIEEHQEEYIKKFQKFVQQPSVAVSGYGIPQMIQLVMMSLEDIGGEVTVFKNDGNPIIYSEIKGNNEHTIGFYGHYDVQPEGDHDLWEDDPYGAVIRDGVIYGRGCADNKNGLVAKLCAVDAWKKVCGTVPCGVKFFIEGEEEVGSPHLESFAKEHSELLRCDGFNWETGSKEVGGVPEIALGSKGMLYVELNVKTAKTEGHSRFAPIVENAAWRLVKALDTLKDEQDNILIEGFYDDVQEPTKEMIANLRNDNLNEEDLKTMFGIEHFINGVEEEEMLKKYYFTPTANICGLSSGYIEEGQKAIVPCQANAKIDFRLVPGQKPERIFELLRTHFDRYGFKDVEIKKVSAMPAYSTSENSPFFKIVKNVLTEMFEEPVVHNMMTGTTPMPIFCEEQEIPVATFGCSSETAGIHAPNEHQHLGSWVDEIKVMAAVMGGLGEL